MLHKDAPKTVKHAVAGCKMLARTAYTERQVAEIVYRNIMAKYGLGCPQFLIGHTTDRG